MIFKGWCFNILIYFTNVILIIATKIQVTLSKFTNLRIFATLENFFSIHSTHYNLKQTYLQTVNTETSQDSGPLESPSFWSVTLTQLQTVSLKLSLFTWISKQWTISKFSNPAKPLCKQFSSLLNDHLNSIYIYVF